MMGETDRRCWYKTNRARLKDPVTNNKMTMAAEAAVERCEDEALRGEMVNDGLLAID